MLYVCIIIVLDWSKNSQGHFFALRKSLEVSMGNSAFYWSSNPSTGIHCWEKIRKLGKWVWHYFIKNIGQYLNACHSLLAWQMKKVIFKQDNHGQWKMNLLKVQKNGKLVGLKRNSLSRFHQFVINYNCEQLVCLGKKKIFFFWRKFIQLFCYMTIHIKLQMWFSNSSWSKNENILPHMVYFPENNIPCLAKMLIPKVI